MEKKCKPSLGQLFNGKLLLTDDEKLTIINVSRPRIGLHK